MCWSLMAPMVKQCGRPRFVSWVGKVPWKRKWQSTPALLPGKSHGRRSLIGYSPWVAKSQTQLSDFTSVQSLSYPTPWDPMNHSLADLPVHHQLPEFTQTRIHWECAAIQPSHSLSSPSPPALIFPSIRVFSNESALRIRWPKYWSFSFNINPSKEIPGLVSFRMDWLDLLAVQRTLKSLLQQYSSKNQFFGSQFSL